MKRIFWLIRKEFKLLKNTILVMAAILTIFTAAFFSMVSIRSDLASNFYNKLDNENATASVWVSDVTTDVIFSTWLEI